MNNHRNSRRVAATLACVVGVCLLGAWTPGSGQVIANELAPATVVGVDTSGSSNFITLSPAIPTGLDCGGMDTFELYTSDPDQVRQFTAVAFYAASHGRPVTAHVRSSDCRLIRLGWI